MTKTPMSNTIADRTDESRVPYDRVVGALALIAGLAECKGQETRDDAAFWRGLQRLANESLSDMRHIGEILL